MIGGLDPEVKQARGRRREAACRQLGAEVVEISLPHTDYAIATYYIIATAEASANLARFDGIRYGARVDGADPIELYGRTRGAGFGAGGEAPHHPRHLRAEQRLLRRLLPARAEGPHADPPGFPEGLRAGGRHRHAHHAHRRRSRSARSPTTRCRCISPTSSRLLQPGRALRHQRALRLHPPHDPNPRVPIGLQLLGNRLARKPFSASPTPTNRARAGIGAATNARDVGVAAVHTGGW